MRKKKLQEITKIVAYYRLSQPKKGKTKSETLRDAYGIEDQKREVARFAAECGARIVAEFSEIETGTKKEHRPELDKAIYAARMHRATIVIGKQDRLARDIRLIANLMGSGIHFVSVDRPDQSEFETQLRAVIDEEEARRISDRTKRGMAIAREKGIKFGFARPDVIAKIGHLRGFKEGGIASGKARREACKEAYGFLLPVIREYRQKKQSYAKIAEELNRLGHITTAGNPFNQMAVIRVIRLFELT